MRFGTVALVGQTNVGKSTFLNAALGVNLAITSRLPQTTRDALLGVLTTEDAQIAFVDTPGLHRPRNELGRRMNAAALQAAREADVLVFMTDRLAEVTARTEVSGAEVAPKLATADLSLLRQVLSKRPSLAIINKVDRVRQKSDLLPTIDALARLHPFAAVIPTSMLDRKDVQRVLAAIIEVLPEGPRGYDDDTLTDRPTTFFVREFVREQVLRSAEREVPHAVAVSVDSIEASRSSLTARATLHVEKPGQRRILVGREGSRIREIGRGARERLHELLGGQVHLELFVRVTPRWKNLGRQLAELGYDPPRPTTRPKLGRGAARSGKQRRR
jgi:GTP-binding protein Era